MNIVYFSLLLFFGLMGLIAIIVIALKPKLFWTMLIFSVVSGGGVMVYGYCLIDEYLIDCLLFGAPLAFSVRPICQRYVSQKKSRFSKIHFQVFLLFMCYMIFQSSRGLIVLDDLRMMRFVIFFMMLGILSYILYKGFFPVPSHKNIIKIVLFSTLVYFVMYLGHGILAELIRGINRFDVQGHEWSGSTVAMFPLFTAIPAVYFVLRKKSGLFLSKDNARKQMWLAWAVVIIAVATSFYYDSRISWIIITGFLVLSIRDLGLSKSLKIFIIFCVFFFILLSGPLREHNFIAKISDFYSALFISGAGLQESDLNRKLEILAAFRLITDDIKTIFFGTGFYTERYTLIPYYIETLSKYGLTTGITNIIRPATFSSLLAGSGLIGVFFLFLCFFLTALEIIVNTRGPNIKGRKILLFTLLIVFLSTIISINLDLVLFYLCIMPSGLLIQLSKYGTSI